MRHLAIALIIAFFAIILFVISIAVVSVIQSVLEATAAL